MESFSLMMEASSDGFEAALVMGYEDLALGNYDGSLEQSLPVLSWLTHFVCCGRGLFSELKKKRKRRQK
jgi:hypothetical protein